MAATMRSTRRSTRLTNTTEPSKEVAKLPPEFAAANVKEEIYDEEMKIKQEPVDEMLSVIDTGIGSANSLAVLAEAAQSCTLSETMPSTVKLPKVLKHKQLIKKSTGSRHIMTLNEIWALNDKQLLQMFSELTSNELSRNFAYTCYLMPEKCAEIFTSFGNENKAKSEMLFHLLNHLKVLLNQAKTNPDFVFSAQTVQSRRKHGSGLDKLGNRKRRSKESIVGKKTNGEKPSTECDSHKASLSTVGPSSMPQPSEQKDDKTNNNDLQFTSGIRRGRRATKGDALPRLSKKPDVLPVQVKVEPNDALDAGAIVPPNCSLNETPVVAANAKHCREKSGLEMFKKQPYIDHSYFTSCLRREKKEDSKESCLDVGTSRTSGWKYGMNEEIDDDDKQILSVVIRVQTGITQAKNKLYIPIVRVPKSLAYRTQSGLGVETDINTNAEENKLTSAAASLKINNNNSDSDCDSDEATADDDYEDIQHSSRHRKRFEMSDPGSEMERKLAMKYINELRCKKKDESLMCKICKNKPFTAAATLMYHYRSHAGIKPFVCLICNTTFTRQHSLNYHMLIHNNLNRFTCKDCGRMFRHPSHFKEHLRRHTGETPFLCTDCPQRFKTRNTYKRHLRTRHGKLLLASGIRIMSRDEFLKVRTKPYLDERQEDDGEYDKASVEDEVEMMDVQELGQRQSLKQVQETMSRKPAILSHSSANRNLVSDASNISFPM